MQGGEWEVYTRASATYRVDGNLISQRPDELQVEVVVVISRDVRLDTITDQPQAELNTQKMGVKNVGEYLDRLSELFNVLGARHPSTSESFKTQPPKNITKMIE